MRLSYDSDSEIFIEFAQRASPEERDHAWDDRRREIYLLRTNIQRPLSVDERVWSELLDDPSAIKIAITVVLRGMSDEQRALWLPRKLRVAADVNRIGYDVADRAMTSGLSNCGYSVVEKANLVPSWEAFLNQYHLFDEMETAMRFRRTTDERVPEHKPFYVFGIYRFGGAQ